MNKILIGFLNAVIRIATPLILGGMGEMLIEKVGILNLGIEGTMLLGAFFGFLLSFVSHSPFLGLLAAMMVGSLSALALGSLVVGLNRRQHVSGIGLTILTMALSAYFFRVTFGLPPSPPQAETFKYLEWPGILRQYPLTYAALVIALVLKLALDFTPFGLRLKAAGEDPEALESSGVSVARTRYLALAIGGALIGAAGAFLSISQLGYFTPDIVSGRGWVCLALVTFGNFKPMGVIVGALLFAAVEAAQIRLQTLGVRIPSDIFSLTPYLLTVLFLALGKRTQVPKAFGKPYEGKEG